MDRYTELKRTSGLSRTKRVKPVSDKRKALKDEVRDERAAFVQEAGLCQCCGKAMATCTHEISSGTAARAKSLSERAAWLGLCWGCNSNLMTDHAKWPIVRQLVLKALHDAAYFDRVKVNELRNRAPNAISEAETIRAAYEMGREQR